MTDLRQTSTFLVRRYQCGDARAFDALVRLWDQRLFALAYRLTGDRHEAEDIRQETWVRCHLGLESLRAPETFAAWVARIVVNLSRDSGRRRRLTAPGDAEAPPGPVDPAAACETAETHAALRRALDSLPALEREILILRVVQELSFDEIARALSKPRTTVQWLCGTALSAVARSLKRTTLVTRSGDAVS